MLIQALAKLLGTSIKTVEFLIVSRKVFYFRLLFIVPLTIWSVALSTVLPLFWKYIIDAVNEKWTTLFGFQLGTTFNVFLAILLGYLTLNILDKTLRWAEYTYLHNIKQDSEASLEDRFINFLTRFDASFLGSENNLRIIRNLQWSFVGIQENLLKLIISLIQIPAKIISLAFIIPLLHPYLLVAILITAIFNIAFDNLKSSFWRVGELRENRVNEQKNNLKYKLINYFNTLLTNGWVSRLHVIYQKARSDYFRVERKQFNRNERLNLAQEWLNQGLFCLTYAMTGFLVVAGQITLGTFTIIRTYIGQVEGFLYSISGIFREVVDLRFQIFKLEFILTLESKLNLSDLRPIKLDSIDTLEISNLHFKYPEFYEDEKEYFNRIQSRLGLINGENLNWIGKLIGLTQNSWTKEQLQKEFKELIEIFEQTKTNKIILQNLNIKFNKGNIYGIVGYNGAGKTTLTRLIKRILDPTSGQIIINNQYNLINIDPLEWKSYIGAMEQSSFLIDGMSIRDNLTLGLKDRNIEDQLIWDALKKVELEDHFESLDQIIGENTQTSGGQAQLLEIARILISKKSIIILDEGTNQLDAIKESKIMGLIRELAKDSIVLFITHRMTTCLKCDQVLVLDDGEIKAIGNPQALIEATNPNLFQTFWNTQIGKN